MKRFIITVLASMSVVVLSAQSKVAYIYSERVFKAQPEYALANQTIDDYAKQGEEIYKNKVTNVETMFKEFQETESRMSELYRTSVKNEIIKREQEATDYQEDYFGEEGFLATKQMELMKPIEEKVLKAVNSIAEQYGYDMIFDLSTTKSTIYQNPKLDVTDLVIDALK